MKRYLVDGDAVKKISSSFASPEEAKDFFLDLDEFVREMAFFTQYRERVSEEEASITLIKQTFSFVSFCRAYIDLIQQFIRNFECRELSEEELKKLKEKDND